MHPGEVLFSFNEAFFCAKQLVSVSLVYCSVLMLGEKVFISAKGNLILKNTFCWTVCGIFAYILSERFIYSCSRALVLLQEIPLNLPEFLRVYFGGVTDLHKVKLESCSTSKHKLTKIMVVARGVVQNIILSKIWKQRKLFVMSCQGSAWSIMISLWSLTQGPY